jgi:VanZ family protein
MRIYKYLFYIWLITIFTLTSWPTLALPSHNILGLDKLAHFAVYLVLAFLMLKKDNSIIKKQHYFWAVLIPTLDELHQIPIPGRYFDISDIAADLLGFAVIFVLIRFL